MNVATLSTEPEVILRDGWKVLVGTLGLQKATQFIVLLERGKGDTIEDIIAYWGDMSIEDIHNRIVAWRKKRKQSANAIA